MKKVESAERSTGRGATKFTAILLGGEWVQVSRHPGVRHHGRADGVENFSVEVADDAITARFYRSNGGNESVTISTGEEFQSFEDAREWASDRNETTKTCPHCGRVM